MMSESMTAYSTAVGPSSLFKKRFSFMARFFMGLPSDRYFGVAEREEHNKLPRNSSDFIAMISDNSGGTYAERSASVPKMARWKKVRLRVERVKQCGLNC